MTNLYKPFQPTLTRSGLTRFELSLQHSPACKPLSDVVHSYLQIYATKPTPYPVIPDGTQAIFISPDGAKIGGALSQAHDIQILRPGNYFGIRFYPGALRYFFDINLFEITNQFVDSQYFPCRDFGDLHYAIYEREHFHERARVCEQWLLQQFTPQPSTPFDHAFTLIYRSFGNIKVSQLATSIGWSSRHLNRLFRLHTGLSTKSFIQTIRMQQTCKQLFNTPCNAMSTALETGYFDQSHLIKDYKKRLLSNPSVFFKRFKSDFYNR